MIITETILTLFATSIVLALVPGPDNLFVLTQSALHGSKSGWYATLGFSTGLIFHTIAVSLGVAAIFQTSELVFNLLKLVGAAYLLYLAWRFLQASNSQVVFKQLQKLNPWLLYRRGIIMNVMNPKVSLFFLALLPQFTHPDAGPMVLQMMTFGLVFIVATLIVFGGLAELAGAISPWLIRSHSAQRIIHRVAAVVFVVLAIKLLFAEPL
ncbi:MAG: LysE family translocator [Candidatus Thiodiazotropha sp. (ex Lucinoma kastoroae)]|nr:LysE family translocator [Candidatus Thiodiazotropha sp. (ex Rostrolucina anterorostrata)]MCU7849859.1 LysE family translocator [Candidatus Thiodiazotropha sp. (ex Lucinoma kastoroae)]